MLRQPHLSVCLLFQTTWCQRFVEVCPLRLLAWVSFTLLRITRNGTSWKLKNPSWLSKIIGNCCMSWKIIFEKNVPPQPQGCGGAICCISTLRLLIMRKYSSFDTKIDEMGGVTLGSPTPLSTKVLVLSLIKTNCWRLLGTMLLEGGNVLEHHFIYIKTYMVS
jgi:hypothetical protein